MKFSKVISFCAVFALLSVSCEKCYECTYQAGYSYGSSESICGPPAIAKTMKADYESNGYVCREQ